MSNLVFCVYELLALVAITFIIYDTTKRGCNTGLLWSIFAFFLWPFIIPIYLIVRKFQYKKYR